MADYSSHIELSVELDNKNDEQALKHLLSSLPLEAVVVQTLSQAGIDRPVVVALLITNDATIQSLNKHYRNQDKSTDVLSFPLLEKPIVHAPVDQLWMKSELLEGKGVQTQQAFIAPPEKTTHLGDIVISWPTVQRQSSEVGHNTVYELLFLLSHGVLHLIGYDDQTEAGYQAMIRIQQAVLDATGLKI
jgi:probable rRNA maturation factor